MQENPWVVAVTGASRGLGRGIARAFGERGAIVYVTARTLAALELVMGEIIAHGGKPVAIECDHRDDAQVAACFVRIADEAGRLDILVNNAAAVYPDALIAPGPFWEKPIKLAEMLDVGLRSNYIASYFAAPLMIAARRGLIANISFYGAVSYFHGPAYGAAKAGTDKMSFDMAEDLRPHGVSAVSIWPGFVRTEAVAAMTPEQIPPDLAALWPLFETPDFTGRIIAGLYQDSELAAMSGRALIGAELGIRYGIADLDGKIPVSFRASMGAPAQYFNS